MSYRFMRYPEGKIKAVTFSYDDGAKYDLRLAEMCTKCGIKCTFNICKPEGQLSKDEIRKHILDKGHEIAVHCYTHKAPGNSTDIEIINDVLTCRKELEKEYDTIVKGMAYPDCGIKNVTLSRYEEIKAILKSLDIVYARTLGKDNNEFKLPDDWYAWMPTAHHDNPNVISWANEFVNTDFNSLYYSSRHPRLFYLWGHSFEFENNQNWEHLEEICKALGNKADIWYAANTEIYNYVNAYNSLVWNAAGTKVFNPTVSDVWFTAGENDYCVKSGETINLKSQSPT